MINNKDLTGLSKFLSLVLRHNPKLIGIELDQQGWTNVEMLIKKMNEFGKAIDLLTLEKVVSSDNKKRYVFDSTGEKIRASQGHSIEIDLGYEPKIPPDHLYHGTATRFVESILKSGLQKQGRHHVHLSPNVKTAIQVGQRHGKPAVFEVDSKKMHEQGTNFYLSDNGVWLTDEVPVEFLRKLSK